MASGAMVTSVQTSNRRVKRVTPALNAQLATVWMVTAATVDAAAHVKVVQMSIPVGAMEHALM